MGAGSALLLAASMEGIALYYELRTIKRLKIAKINEDADETVEKMSDTQLRNNLDNDLK